MYADDQDGHAEGAKQGRNGPQSHCIGGRLEAPQKLFTLGMQVVAQQHKVSQPTHRAQNQDRTLKHLVAQNQTTASAQSKHDGMQTLNMLR